MHAKLALWLIPGGQLGAIASAVSSIALTVLGWALSFVKWLVSDVTDAFKEPQRLVVRSICLIGALVFGLWAGADHRARKDVALIKQLRTDLASAVAERDDWRQREDDQKKRADEADKARKKAEDAAKTAVVPAAPPAGRVYRQPAAAGVKPASTSGYWLPRF
jgi:hypothetical protein